MTTSQAELQQRKQALGSAPLVTIGLPVYNSERYIKQSLDSLLGQTYPNFLLVISDNASTDGTAGICESYVSSDSRIQYHRNPNNIGNPRNFNRVAELTKTPYLKWSTSDDYWAPTFLERAMEVMERDPSVALCHPQAYLVDAAGGSLSPYDDPVHLVQQDPAERFRMLLRTIGLAHQHLGVIRMSFLKRTHLLRTHVGSDVTLLAELALYGKLYQLPERLFYRRFHPTSGSWKRGNSSHEAMYYHADRSRKTGMRAWHSHVGLFSAVNAGPLPLRAKASLNVYLLQRMSWDRRNLFLELWDTLRRM